MKICPRCQKSYPDDNLNFCLEDGTVLTQASADSMAQTVMMPEPRVTHQNQQMPSFPNAQQTGHQQGSQPSWNPAPPQYSMQPPTKSSKSWLWVVGILGVLVLLCGGGLVAFFAWAASQANKTTYNFNVDNTAKTSPTPLNNSKTNSGPTSSRTSVSTVDLEPWVHEDSTIGNTSFTNGEFYMGSKKKGYYYVLAAPDSPKNKTELADSRVTLRNVDNAASSLGYGLIFHSNPTPLQQDYAFLIDTKKKKYRVVHHEPKNELSVVSWTSSDSIKDGSQENTLEVRDGVDKFELYINGTMVTSVKNVYGYKGGVAGLYSGDGVNIAFKNLEIRK